jgi:aspartyl-tRNA(Asn)/glutamyl-tRNA(Gln) amidotransferase subunit A
MSDLTRLTIAEARDALAKKEFSAVDLTDAYIAAMEAHRDLNAYIIETPEKAREMAKASDERIAAGKAGALEGIPLGIKDLFATEGVHTQACSHILDGFKPAYESTVTSNLWRDGAVMLGKLNMDEFAMGSSNETSYYGPVKNPWKAKGDNKDLVPGGSSGRVRGCRGCAHVRRGHRNRYRRFNPPASRLYRYCRHQAHLWPLLALGHRGIRLFARSGRANCTRCARCGYPAEVHGSVDEKDTTSVDIEVPDYEAAIGKSVKGMKIGVPAEYRVDGMPEEIERLWQQGIAWLKDAGAEIVEISLPHTKYALPAYYIVAPAEASSNLARYDGVRYGLRVPGDDIISMYENTRAEGFGKEVQRRIMIGTYVLSAGYYDAYYVKAQKVRTLIKRDFETVFAEGVDAILTPATPSAAFGVADQDMASDPVKMYLNDIFTVTVNMAGLPGIAVPAGLNDAGLPLGLQLIGKPFDEATLFQLSSVIEQQAGKFSAFG